MNNSDSKHRNKNSFLPIEGSNRRSFLKNTTAATLILSSTDILSFALNSSDITREPLTEVPWFLLITRWGQINITEKDLTHFDIAWWRNHWKSTQIQGVLSMQEE